MNFIFRSKTALRSVAIALAAIVAINLPPRPAQAIILMIATPVTLVGLLGLTKDDSGEFFSHPGHSSFDYILVGGLALMAGVAIIGVCGFTHSFCVLDKDSNGEVKITKRDLIDNGYSPALADSIMAQAHRLMQILAENHLQLARGPFDSQQSLALEIKKIMPESTPVFQEFYSEAMIRIPAAPVQQQNNTPARLK